MAVWISMHVIEAVFGGGWAVFWLYWLIAAFHTKKGHVSWRRELAVRAVVVAVALVLLRLGALRGSNVGTDAWRTALGLVLFALGLGFAVWARVSIGRNWGSPMTQKVEPELVTTGPYRLVRHPIYSGILAAGAAPRWR